MPTTAATRSARTAFAVSTAALAASLLSGCGATSAPAESSAPTSSVATTDAPTATATSTSTTKPATPACAVADLKVKLGDSKLTASGADIPLVFTNDGKAACSLTGFPQAIMAGIGNRLVGAPATHEGTAGGTVNVAPGATAHATLFTVRPATVPVAECGGTLMSMVVQVTVPGATTPVRLGFNHDRCVTNADKFAVGPFTAAAS